jgi:glyoxylase-like metal-dependent hydrolase (beta-lactamase superfamily II)
MYDNNETNYLIEYINKEQLTPQAIINTHAHLDHIFGIAPLVAKYSIPFGLHEKDLVVLQRADASAAMFGVSIGKVPDPTFYITDGQLQLGDDTVEVRFTPGHSPGSIVFYYQSGNWVIGGDVLFNGSIGRTDLPGGNFDVLAHSIRTQMYTLPDNTTVYSGHGPATTIGREKQYNPFVQG